MAIKANLSKQDDLIAIERKVSEVHRKIDIAAPDGGQVTDYEVGIVSDWSDHLFAEQWGGILVAAGVGRANRIGIKALGLKAWPDLNDESVQLCIPSLLALQHDAKVQPANGTATLDPVDLRRYVVDQQGVLGKSSGRWRSLVEFDPEADVAPVLNRGGLRRSAFLAFVRDVLYQLEVGAYGMREPGQDAGARQTVLEFLAELHMNGWEHARGSRGVRVVRLEKHLYLHRDRLVRKAGDFEELAGYIGRQARGDINLVEASVSDYGPGILTGFLSSFVGERHQSADRGELLDRLVHDKLSSKAGDPNAGLGIPHALEAARMMHGFVSLRSEEFWLTLDGSGSDPTAKLTRRPGTFPRVQGTHWQLLYPDMIATSRAMRSAPL